MAEIHLIKKDPSLPQITAVTGEGPDIFRSGYWKIAESKAKKLIGGNIFFHKQKVLPSFCGGVIKRTEKVGKGQMYAGRTIFIFKCDKLCRDKATPLDGWGQEKKYIW